MIKVTNCCGCLCAILYLNAVWYSCAVHPAGHINCVTPDVILGFPGSNHSCYHRAHVQS